MVRLIIDWNLLLPSKTRIAIQKSWLNWEFLNRISIEIIWYGLIIILLFSFHSLYVWKDQYAHGMKKDLRPVPVFRQREGEHKRAFYSRYLLILDCVFFQSMFDNKCKCLFIPKSTRPSLYQGRRSIACNLFRMSRMRESFNTYKL